MRIWCYGFLLEYFVNWLKLFLIIFLIVIDRPQSSLMWIEKIQQITLTNPQSYSSLFSEKKIIQTKIPIQTNIEAVCSNSSFLKSVESGWLSILHQTQVQQNRGHTRNRELCYISQFHNHMLLVFIISSQKTKNIHVHFNIYTPMY